MNRRSPPPPSDAPAGAPPTAPSTATPPPAPANGPSFEAAIKRLSEIVQTLERGDLPLEESLRLFEEGVKLSRVSQSRLDGAEKRVEQLLAVDEQGRARTTPFATDSLEAEDEEPGEAPF
jgi:exodeoxyribonuclease VII small subunit